MNELKIGDVWWGKKIIDLVKLSNGWYVIKTPGKFSEKDFQVKVIFSIEPRYSITPKHAHFAMDFYGKLHDNPEKAMKVFSAIVDVWHGKPIQDLLNKYKNSVQNLSGYNLEHILYAMRWILEQEDINFKGRNEEKQIELDAICKKQNVVVPPGRLGSQLAIALFCDLANGTHPVEAFIRSGLRI